MGYRLIPFVRGKISATAIDRYNTRLLQFCINFSHQQDPEIGHACSDTEDTKSITQSETKSTLLPPHHLTYNSRMLVRTQHTTI